MVQSWAINANGDLYRDANGNMALVSGADAVGQNCVTAMRAQRGEMQYNLTGGMPMGATAFETYNPAAFEAAARKVLGAVAGVVAVTDFAVSRSGNALNYSATIETIYGATFISSQVGLQ
jgi:hypothetical protein